MKSLTNKVVLVTGSGSGIGKTTALEFCRKGAKVILNGRNEAKLIRVQTEFKHLGYAVDYCVANITDYEDCCNLTHFIIKQFGRIDVIVANASISMNARFEDCRPDFFKETIDSNIYSVVMPLFSFLPHLKLSQGSFVIIGSIAGIFGVPTGSAYSAGKMALTALHQSLSAELSIHNIHIGILYLGFTENDADKKTYSPQGKLIPVPQRNKIFRQSKEKVAGHILTMIKYRRSKMILSVPGIVLNFFSRFIPSVLILLLRNQQQLAQKNG